MEEKRSGQKRRGEHGSLKAGRPSSRITREVLLRGVKPIHKSKQTGALDVKAMLADEAIGATVRRYRKKDIILLEGELADGLFYVQDGTVKLSVLSQQGNEATIALLGAGEFFGESCVREDRPLSREAATALTACSVLRIKQRNILQVLHRTHPLLNALISFLIRRNRRVQEDLADQLFNSAEKRLARTLLLLAAVDHTGRTEGVIRDVSQQILGEMIGVTRQRVNFFMNRFRKLGLIEYNHEITVRQSLWRVLVHD